MNWWTHASWSQATMVFFAVFTLLWPLLEGVAYVHRRMRRQQNFIHARPDERCRRDYGWREIETLRARR